VEGLEGWRGVSYCIYSSSLCMAANHSPPLPPSTPPYFQMQVQSAAWLRREGQREAHDAARKETLTLLPSLPPSPPPSL